ncbi:MAG: copper amine oxidase N-terminal domain-containing protein [Clostridia bacterium]|nr:copper amine oxidase N-terminal domain-containing protein [Clostridia bacterium]
MKKILSLILAAAMLLSTVCFVSAEEAAIPDKVEISFKVGDSTLMINGNAVAVETPYIAGAGTTLVPLRVITEAFGARVTWVGDTKEIILEYPDVNITLQIGNVNATVNNHTETLPEAPVLSPNGVTMVPLRFISETFGATVGYDNATAAITVVKEAAKENDTISSSTDLPKIGDSYWGWSMMRPAGMMMTDRYLDGGHTLFESENDAKLTVNIYDVNDYEDKEYNAYYRKLKSDMQSVYTLSKDSKGKDIDGNDSFRITGRDKNSYMDFYAVYNGDTAFHVCFTTKVGDEQIPSLTTIIESFKAKFENDGQTHDLSNVEDDGYRLITDEDLKISFKVPATMVDAHIDRVNLLWLVSGKKNDCTEVTIGVYSKTEQVTSRLLAQEDKYFHENYYDAKLTSTSEIYDYKTYPTGDKPYYYVFTTDGISAGDYQMCDVYFEKGDYVYNVTVTHPVKDSSVFHKVMETLTVEELDSEAVGVLLREGREREPYTTTGDNWKMEINTAWEEKITASATSADAKVFVYANNYTGAVLTLTVSDIPSITRAELEKVVEEWFATQADKGKRVEKISEGVSGGNGFYKFVIKTDPDDSGRVFYYTAYVVKSRTRLVVFELIEPEETANALTETEVFDMIGTFEFTK